MRLIEYVIAHELVHLRHQEHSKAFWAVLGRALPDYERRKEELRRMGARLEW
jgi:predicted metal-dependent hydrolase